MKFLKIDPQLHVFKTSALLLEAPIGRGGVVIGGGMMRHCV